ncbi:unnamed protein product [Lepeophtheirus salmonis]|uniref:(salmon louse) hypothetical protein n=1 Tax=Lepeophtheirus salmonis TaxID=72036 RepID=A0A7R8H3N8_LEPSM|nr:unnamed protein product [Lepeophtheirus salmonis]CAF2833336.1 unnamed protein product [Lepeophtheirus salmonis]
MLEPRKLFWGFVKIKCLFFHGKYEEYSLYKRTFEENNHSKIIFSILKVLNLNIFDETSISKTRDGAPIQSPLHSNTFSSLTTFVRLNGHPQSLLECLKSSLL